jgi:hypothetical protein
MIGRPSRPPAPSIRRLLRHPPHKAPLPSISKFADAIDSIKTNHNLPSALSFFRVHLTRANKTVVTPELLFEADILPYILPLVDFETDYELLMDALTVIASASLASQPPDSCLQNPKFLSQLINVLDPERSSTAEQILIILGNLLIDDTIRSSVHEVLSELSIVSVVTKDVLLERFPGLVGSVIWNYVDSGEVVDAEDLLPVISASMLLPEIGYPFVGALSALTRDRAFAETVLGTDLPEKLVTSLRLFHGDSVEPVFECIFHLCETGVFHPAFCTLSFLNLCAHLLQTTPDSPVNRILGVLDILPVDSVNGSDALVAVVAVLREGAFGPRKNAGLVLMRYLRDAPDDIARELVTPGVISALAANIPSMEPQDVAYLLETCERLMENVPELADRILGGELMTAITETIEEWPRELRTYAELFVSPVRRREIIGQFKEEGT